MALGGQGGGTGTSNPRTIGCGVLVGLLVILVGCQVITSGNDQPAPPAGASATARPPTSSGTSTGPSLAPVVNEATYEGELRLADGVNFTSGKPEPSSPYGGTLGYTDFQDRLGPGGRGNRLIARWTGGGTPTYDQCITTLQTNAYGSGEEDDLPIADGNGFCINDDDQVIVFVRLGEKDGEALRIYAKVWRYTSGSS